MLKCEPSVIAHRAFLYVFILKLLCEMTFYEQCKCHPIITRKNWDKEWKKKNDYVICVEEFHNILRHIVLMLKRGPCNRVHFH